MLVTLCEQPAGVTVPSHLSPADWRKVRSLALIELTALFDRLGITYARRKNTRRKTKESPLYGVPLTTLLEQDNARHAPMQHKVPLIIREILDHLRRHGLQEEGILRVSGSALKIDARRSPSREGRCLNVGAAAFTVIGAEAKLDRVCLCLSFAPGLPSSCRKSPHAIQPTSSARGIRRRR
ncbi:hypothetical protein HPB50_013941 [Hyalomma asiaticum]|uniref:Uncharacterized protein n=1 Tax=Hyalomma asiaticum TaxID=266040 RepID=A0ACB7S3P3_HYAAI|nr:hypothetical protein HPB50_013941 [Hyalomma asiaticum]